MSIATAPPPPGWRTWLRAVLGLLALLGAASVHALGLDDIAGRARALAARPYKAPAIRMPPELANLDYDAYRDIRFRPERALWRADKLPFELMFFVQGRAVREPVAINIVEPRGVQPLAFDPAAFDFGRTR